ncbi:hypothetical protein E0L36_12840 [Streptomyces sp. AJS327]|uniref:PD40 domain-containing protein n=1 Tax=Streptomyces sp. AJS327 TaxID=2545265 RepID=UPI0015DD60C4|nr:PD40 domain-containing protein [Streptomyces sp. AJS327]MBA0051752.1 hypothetical protein [Streptomyces sp. AJS327]
MRLVTRTALGATLVGGLTAAILPVLASADEGAEPSAPRTQRVSTAADGTEADGPSRDAVVSRDGTLAVFTSEATNLVPGDTNGAADIFVKHLKGTGDGDSATGGAVERISVEGRTASSPVLSADGRYVAFETEDGEDDRRVHVHDRKTGKTERISTEGVGHDVQSWSPAISADGGSVAFVGTPPPDDKEAWVYVTDRAAGTTKALKHARPDWQPRSISQLTLSDDGGTLAYQYNHFNGPRADCCDVFTRKLTDEKPTQLDAESTSDQQKGRDSTRPAITADGGSVVFQSGDDGLVPDDGDKAVNVFVGAMGAELKRVPGRHSEDSTFSGSPVPSPDGKRLLYTGHGTSPTYLMDVDSDEAARPVTPDAEGNYVETRAGALSDGAAAVAYTSPDAIAEDDGNEAWDVYVAHTG